MIKQATVSQQPCRGNDENMARFTSIQRGHIFILCLVIFNAFVLYMNFVAVSKTTDFKKIRQIWRNGEVNGFNEKNQAQNESRQNIQSGRYGVKWSEIENRHKYLPAYNKMRNTLSNLLDYMPSFRRQASYLQLEHEMFRYKSVTNEGDISRLEAIIADVLMTNRSISIGLIGGAQSNAPLCGNDKCLYVDLVVEWLKSILGVNVFLHNAALPLSSSSYYSWCLEPHLDVSKMDIIIVEVSVEDFLYKNLISKTRYNNPGQPQEELTRRLLSLPNKPYILYYNFLSVEDIKNRDCLNSEQFAGKYLARHYNITNISWGIAVCSSIYRAARFMPNELIHAGHVLSVTAHKQASLFFINFLRKVIDSVAVAEIHKAQSDEKYIKTLIELHDVFKRNSERDTATFNSFKMQPNFEAQLPPPRWPAKWLLSTECWPASLPQHIIGYKLTFPKNGGWEMIFSDRENWFTSTGTTEILEFPFRIAKKVNQTAVVSLASVVCGYCGQALVFLDGEVKKSKLLYGTWPKHAFRIDEVFTNVTPGNHTLFISSLEDKPYKLASVMVGYHEVQ